MHNARRTIPKILLGLVLLAGLAAYRAYIDQSTFIAGFDKTVATISAGLWQLLQNPIILTALVVYSFLWLGRDHWPLLLSAIDEIRAGDISAKFNASKLLSMVAANSSSVTPEKPDLKLASEDIIAKVIDNLDDGVGWYLLKVANKSVTYEDHVDILIQETGIDRKYNMSSRKNIATGYLMALLNNFNNFLFKVTKEDEPEGYAFRISPETLQLIRKKVEFIP